MGRALVCMTAVFLLLASGAARAQGWRDGYAGAEPVLKEKCAAGWPGDYKMQSFCMKQQRAAVRALGGYRNETAILDKCEGEWPRDYKMQEFCARQQVEARAELEPASAGDIPANIFIGIRRKCEADWPGDFKMRAFCERQQREGYREVSR